MNYQPLIDLARELGCTVTENASMAQATTFRIGGPADLLIDLPTATAAAQIIALCHKESIPYLFIGNGSNLLVGDKGIRGAVLRLADDGAEPQMLSDNRLYAPGGMQLKRLCIFAREQSLTGLEFAFGIPGTVGGGLYMNAGAYGGEMADVVESADFPVEMIKTAIRKATIANEMVPVVCGTSYKNKGVQQVLDAVVDYMPSTLDKKGIKGDRKSVV